MTIPFRAGNAPGGMQPAAQAAFAGAYTLLADVSEFQPDVADAVYLGWSKAIVIRAAYGSAHDDHAWYGGQRRALLHAGGVKFLGIYQYVVAGQDPVAQAKALVRLLGTLRPGEKVIADIEEGGGSQAARRDAWAAVIEAELGDVPWTYSGLYFSESHGLAPVEWVAAYGQAEPAVRHRLWQFTDAFQVPGVGTCDCSVFHGTVDELAALAYQPAPAPPPSPAPVWAAGLVLRFGSQGDAVRALQQALRDSGLRGVRGIAVDGQFGSQTQTAVEEFQQLQRIGVDGIAGKVTRNALIALGLLTAAGIAA